MEPQDIEMNPVTNNNINEQDGLISDMSLCEQRLISDIAEYKRSQIVGTICKTHFNNYIKNNDKFELIIEFINYFSVKFIFDQNYPITPPCIVYHNGLKIKNIFDIHGNVLIESIKKENWNKSIWLSTLVFYIELLISKETEGKSNLELNNYSNDRKEKYGKRKWNDYVNEENKNYLNLNITPQLERNLKRLKDQI